MFAFRSAQSEYFRNPKDVGLVSIRRCIMGILDKMKSFFRRPRPKGTTEQPKPEDKPAQEKAGEGSRPEGGATS
jgi:hypothetical protein